MPQEVSLSDIDGSELEEIVVKINRVATVVKGGKRFSFSALAGVGNRKGIVGYGFGKANEVPQSIEKSIKDAQRRLIRVPIINGTIPHKVIGTYGSSSVVMLPASPGTGIIAGNAVRALLELVGVHNILTKSTGSNNPLNVVKAVYNGLSQMTTQEEIERIRGVKVEYVTH